MRYTRWFFVSAFLVLIQLRNSLSLTTGSSMSDASRSYSLVPGFFIQDNVTTAPAVPPRFGLIDSGDNRWVVMQEKIKKLNKKARHNEKYKLIIFARHGEGFHNVAEAKYGTPAWNDYWSKLNGDGEIVWGPDAELTDLGKVQAKAINTEWKSELKYDIPVPKKRYISPMSRALNTYLIEFDGIRVRGKPLVLENCREVYSVHTCDKRHPRTYISNTFPEFKIEKCFSEEDELWTADERESDEHAASRAKAVLDVIFDDKEDEPVISVTAHSGIINGFMNATGRHSFSLQTGGVLPMVVKSTFAHDSDERQ